MLSFHIQQQNIIDGGIIHYGIFILFSGLFLVSHQHIPLVVVLSVGQNFFFVELVEQGSTATDDTIMVAKFIFTTGRRTYRRNTGYLPIPKRPSPSIPFSARSNGFKRPRPLRKRTRRGLPMRNGKTSGQHGPKHEGGAYHQLLPHQ